MVKQKIITIQGATATGKSKLALKFAKHYHTEIISADSRQIYRFMNIGTAKPTLKEREEIVHHLIDIINPDEQYNAGAFVQDSKKIISKLGANGQIPIIAGGTGFYLESLKTGLFKSPEIPKEIRENLREIAKKESSIELYERLEKVDKIYAKRINKNDKNRILRALEIWEATGKSIIEHWKEQKQEDPYDSFDILIEIEREKLYPMINSRVEEMVENGLLAEILSLIKRGYQISDPGMNTVGYKEYFQHTNIDDYIKTVQQNTRNYAKRQLTWYRKRDFDLTLNGCDINILEVMRKLEEWIGVKGLEEIK